MNETNLKIATYGGSLVQRGDIITLQDFWMSLDEAENTGSHIAAKENRPVLVIEVSSTRMTFVPLSSKQQKGRPFALRSNDTNVSVMVEYPIINQIFTADQSKAKHKIGFAPKDVVDQVVCDLISYWLTVDRAEGILPEMRRYYPELTTKKSVDDETHQLIVGENTKLKFELRTSNGKIQNLESDLEASKNDLENQIKINKEYSEKLTELEAKLKAMSSEDTKTQLEEALKREKVLIEKVESLKGEKADQSARLIEANNKRAAIEARVKTLETQRNLLIAGIVTLKSNTASIDVVNDADATDLVNCESNIMPAPVEEPIVTKTVVPEETTEDVDPMFSTDLSWCNSHSISDCMDWYLNAPKHCPSGLTSEQRKKWANKRRKVANTLYWSGNLPLDEYYAYVEDSSRHPDTFKRFDIVE